MTQLAERPILSVLVAAYNVEQYLLECLDSLKSQTLKEVEFLIVDDGSSDRTPEIIQSYLEDSRFKLIKHEENSGLLLARKHAVERAIGDFCIFVDGDDFLGYPDALADLIELATVENVDILRFGADAINEDGTQNQNRSKHINRVGKPQYDSRDIARQYFFDRVHPWNLWLSCYKSSVLKKAYSYVPEVKNFTACEDGFASFLIAIFSNTYKPIQTKPIYIYRLGSGVTSGGWTLEKFKKFSQETLCIQWIRDVLIKHDSLDRFETILSGFENALFSSLAQRFFQMPESMRRDALNLLPASFNKSGFILEILKVGAQQRKLVRNSRQNIKVLKTLPPGRLFRACLSSIWRSVRNKIKRLRQKNKKTSSYRGMAVSDVLDFRKAIRQHNAQFGDMDIKAHVLYFHAFRDEIHLFLRKNINFSENRMNCSAYAGWGINHTTMNEFKLAVRDNKPFFLLEDGFIRSIYTWVADVEPFEKSGLSYTVETKGYYFDCMEETDLENLLNHRPVTLEEKSIAERVIKLIVNNKITKYNNQPLEIGVVGKTRKKKVLVIDQSYGDMSLICGGVTDSTFEQMLEDAISENPDCEILFKIHPDTIARKQKSGFQKFVNKGITIVDGYANPISLLEQVDKVYVATSQMGFEALLCGKEVHVYGLPFYAGWGLTIDKQTCHRRQRKLSLNELFYITYLVYSNYINPLTGDSCDVDDVIAHLLKEREKLLTVAK